MSYRYYCMKTELKQQVINAISKLTEEDIVKENVYKCGNDGMVCFNGFIAELINGKEYEWEDYEDSVYEQAYQDCQDDLVTELNNNRERDPKHPNYMDDDEFDTFVEEQLESFEPDIDTYGEALDMAQEQMTDDLRQLYEDGNTLQEINDAHYGWVSGETEFDVAVAEFERIIVTQE